MLTEQLRETVGADLLWGCKLNNLSEFWVTHNSTSSPKEELWKDLLLNPSAMLHTCDRCHSLYLEALEMEVFCLFVLREIKMYTLEGANCISMFKFTICTWCGEIQMWGIAFDIISVSPASWACCIIVLKMHHRMGFNGKLQTQPKPEIAFCVRAVVDDCNFFIYWHSLTHLSKAAVNKLRVSVCVF